MHKTVEDIRWFDRIRKEWLLSNRTTDCMKRCYQKIISDSLYAKRQETNVRRINGINGLDRFVIMRTSLFR